MGYQKLISLTNHIMGTLRHLTTGFSTPAASLGTLPTMIHVVSMFFALSRAGLADVSAELTNISCVLTTAGHKRNGRVTNLSAIAVEPDAIHHHPHILFAETRFSAGITANSARLTGFDTILVLLRG